MAQDIFRKKALERVNSPEQLNDYIKTAHAGLWLTIAAIVVLFIGIFVWGAFGTLETRLRIPISAQGEEGILTAYIKAERIGEVAVGQKVVIGENEFVVSSIDHEPFAVNKEELSDYAMYVANLRDGEWVYPVALEGSMPVGVYRGYIVVDSIPPVSLIFN